MRQAMNPYRSTGKTKGVIIPGVHKFKGQSSPIVANNGELNASSRQDLLAQIGRYLEASASPTTEMVATAAELARDRKETLLTAFSDTTGQGVQILGETMAAEIHETTAREGFARRVLQYREIGNGEDNLVTLKQKNVTAYLATSASEVTSTEVRETRMRPPMIEINGDVLISTKELAQATGELLEEKYEEGLEAIMVQEDRLWKTMADKAARVRNEIQFFSVLTPTVFSRLIEQVNRWGIPAATCLFSSSLWTDIIANGDFTAILDPVSQHELLQEGFLGTILGVQITTDTFRQPNLKVLDSGEMYIVGAPINHGVFTLQGALTAEPINRFNHGESKKGWFFNQLCSMVLGNAASVSKGKRI